MPRPATSTVATPGVPTTENGETDADTLAADTSDFSSGDEAAAAKAEGEAAETVTMTKAELQAMLNSAVAQGIAAARAPTRKASPEANLPDQSEIDRAKITRPTLSKQGWVLPHNYGEPADPSIKR